VKEGDIDDYRALQEVLRRRLLHLKSNLKDEERKLKELGIAVRKARKTDKAPLTKFLKAHADQVDDSGIDSKAFVLAERKGRVVGCARLKNYPDKTVEFASLFIDEHERGHRLGQFLAKKLLKTMKRGKVYLIAKDVLEEYYAELGFRAVHTAPAPILAKTKHCQKHFGKAVPILLMMFEASKNKPDKSLTHTPDLLLIDGGKGQLGAVLAVMKELKLNLPVIGLAKREEEIFIPGAAAPLSFPKDSQAKFLLMRLRDEAHRFANAHRESRGKKSAVLSSLDAVPGIGDKTRTELIRRFGSLSGIKDATDEDLLQILTEPQLQALREGQ
jgi:N-acetylglutamate synthase-like GNAT family acetyltransferase